MPKLISERTGSNLTQLLLLFFLPLLIWGVMVATGGAAKLFNPVFGCFGGCFWGFMVNGVFMETTRTRQILYADITIGVILWLSLWFWNMIEPVIEPATVVFLTNPMTVVVVALALSRATILIENTYFAKEEGRGEANATLESVLGRVQVLEDRLEEDGQYLSQRLTPPSEPDRDQTPANGGHSRKAR